MYRTVSTVLHRKSPAGKNVCTAGAQSPHAVDDILQDDEGHVATWYVELFHIIYMDYGL
jgi:hypothetical protein